MKPKKIRVLIAEDEIHVRKLLKELLIDIGYHVVGEAADGAAAVEMTLALKPDVVMTDIEMPKMTGLEAAREIQNRCPTPIVILSGYYDEKTVQQATKVGVGAYLKKARTDANDIQHAVALSIAHFNNIQELRQSQEDLRRKKEHIETAHHKFLAAITHEIRESVNAIIRMSDQLSKTELNPVQIEYMENLMRYAKLLSSQLNDVVESQPTVSEPETGRN